MRTELLSLAGQRLTYRATFARYGKRGTGPGSETLTILLFGVTVGNGILVADHIWLWDYTPFMHLKMSQGDRISFRAVARLYTKRGSECDYTLAMPMDARIVKAKPR